MNPTAISAPKGNADRKAAPAHFSLRKTAATLAAVVPAALALVWGAHATTDTEATRETMHRVFEALTTLLPTAFSVSGWEGPVDPPLATLAAAAEQLAEHGRSEDPAFRFLGDSLASDARMIQREVALKRYQSASYFTERVAETCIACHVRLPAASQRDFTKTLLQKVDPAVLTPFAKAYLEMAGRQFGAALRTYERAFQDPTADLGLAEFSDALSSYLIIALRVKRDPARAQRGLSLLERRPDLSAQLERNLATWRTALREFGPALREPPSLARAKQILDAGHALSEFPLDGADRVHCIVAASLLFRFLEEAKPEGPTLAEALYLLARTESFTRRAFEISESESYLEQAVRAAPHTPIAERAYARLELQTMLGYTGGPDARVPPDVAERLAELRELSRTKPRPRGPRPPRYTPSDTARFVP